MSREKQIEEMACEKCIHLEECKRIFRRAKDNGMWEHTTEEQYFSESACDCQFYADKNIYRKSPDVAEKIFAEIEKICGTNGFHFICTVEKFKELKKKYTEEAK